MIENAAWKRAAKCHASARPGRKRGEKAVASATREKLGGSVNRTPRLLSSATAESDLQCHEQLLDSLHRRRRVGSVGFEDEWNATVETSQEHVHDAVGM